MSRRRPFAILASQGRTLFRPLFWLGCAAALAALFSILHLLGWRDDTAIISGTMAPTSGQSDAMIARGLLYGFSYFAAVIVSPILIIAAGFYLLMPGRRKIKPEDVSSTREAST